MNTNSHDAFNWFAKKSLQKWSYLCTFVHKIIPASNSAPAISWRERDICYKTPKSLMTFGDCQEAYTLVAWIHWCVLLTNWQKKYIKMWTPEKGLKYGTQLQLSVPSSCEGPVETLLQSSKQTSERQTGGEWMRLKEQWGTHLGELMSHLGVGATLLLLYTVPLHLECSVF